jgi:hypothetical protein
MATKKKTAKKSPVKKTPAPAKKKVGGRPPKGSGPTKADFIRETLKAGMSASEVVKAGAEKGMKISPPQVYKLKSKASGVGAPTAAAKAKPGPKAKGDQGSASAFVRQHADKKAGEIVELAKKAGIKVTAGLVYTTRAYDKKRSGAPVAKSKPGPKPASAAAPKSGDSKPSASDFIRSQPTTMTASDVLAAGSKLGLRFSTNLIYAVRSAAKKAGGSTAAPKGKPGRKPAPKYETPKFQVFPGSGGGDETELKKAALAVGFPRALEVIQDLAKKAEAVQRQYQALLG